MFHAVKTAYVGSKSNYVFTLYWAFDLVLIAILIVLGITGKFAGGPPKGGSYLMGLAILSLVPKLIASPFLLIEDVVRISHYIYLSVSKLVAKNSSEPFFMSDRRKFVSQLALGLASIPFLASFTEYGKANTNTVSIGLNWFLPIYRKLLMVLQSPSYLTSIQEVSTMWRQY